MDDEMRRRSSAHPIELLSAYRDNALDSGDRIAVEEHLASCAACRERLATYAAIGEALRSDHDVVVPDSLDAKVEAMQSVSEGSRLTNGQPSWLRFVVPTLAGAALIVLVAVFAFVGSPFSTPVDAPQVAAAEPCESPEDCAVRVRFTGTIDRAGVERSVQLDPPVRVTLVWQDETLVVKPDEPLKESVSYTLRLSPSGSEESATPVAVQLVGGGASTPVAVSTAAPVVSIAEASALPTVEQSVATPGDGPLVVAAATSPVPTGSASPAQTPISTPTAARCDVQPIRGFGNVYAKQPAIAAQIGCALGPERGLQAVVQPFERGRLIQRADTGETLALLDDGYWYVFPATGPASAAAASPTTVAGVPVDRFAGLWSTQRDIREAFGNPAVPERTVDAAVEEFERGALFWIDDRIIFILFEDGTWAGYPDTFVEPSTTPTPVVTGSPVATVAATPTTQPRLTPSPNAGGSTPTAVTTPVATSSPSAGVCQEQPIRGFGTLYRAEPEVATRLGCAVAREIGFEVAQQRFEGGLMIRRPDTASVVVLADDGTWSTHPDTWRPGETLADVGTPPEGQFAPHSGLGKVWREAPGVRDALGWATTDVLQLAAAFQPFERGDLFWTAERTIYALYGDGTWEQYPDAFVEPTSTPTPAQ